MKICGSYATACGLTVAVLLSAPLARGVSAQESGSAALAKELTTLLEGKKLDSIAARSPSAPDQFVAALFFPGQLLVVTARYPAPAVLNEKIAKNEYRDVYIDLNSASIPESKVLYTDLGADGLRPKREANQPFDTRDIGPKSIRFDGNWREDKMSEEDYMKAFNEAEQNYEAALKVLIAAAKK